MTQFVSETSKLRLSMNISHGVLCCLHPLNSPRREGGLSETLLAGTAQAKHLAVCLLRLREVRGALGGGGGPARQASAGARRQQRQQQHRLIIKTHTRTPHPSLHSCFTYNHSHGLKVGSRCCPAGRRLQASRSSKSAKL